ncbi:MAG: lysylphosphatidylglycerol synthase transmembrane domain-containing protein [Myxococcota bacterium]
MPSRLRQLWRDHPRATAALRWALGLGLLALTLTWIDPAEVLTPIGAADPVWLALALLLSLPMMLLMAVRWSFTARRMGVELPLRTAWRDYYVSALLNSVLPGGVAGDVVRVARQAGGPARPLGPVARSVVVERAVGQLVLWLMLLTSAVLWGLGDVALAVSVALSIAVIGALVLVGLGAHPRVASTAPGRLIARIRGELRAALLSGWALVVQLSTSVGSLIAFIGMYYCCTRAIGSVMTPAQALLVVPGILAVTTVPLTVGGWGVRELSAMALFELAGIPSADGAASSVLFGAACLVAMLPGVVPLLRRSTVEARLPEGDRS